MKRFIVMTASALVVCCATALGGAAFVRFGPHTRISDRVLDVERTHVGLVLGTGGRIRGNGKINPFFEARVELAAALLSARKVDFLIVSGVTTTDFDEPGEMRDALIGLGAPAQKLYLDTRSTRTLDSILRAHCVFGQRRVLVISQRAHVARALFIAWANGLDDIGAATTEPVGYLAFRSMKDEFLASFIAIRDALTRKEAPCDDTQIKIGDLPPRH